MREFLTIVITSTIVYGVTQSEEKAALAAFVTLIFVALGHVLLPAEKTTTATQPEPPQS